MSQSLLILAMLSITSCGFQNFSLEESHWTTVFNWFLIFAGADVVLGLRVDVLIVVVLVLLKIGGRRNTRTWDKAVLWLTLNG
jgi:hypothetical protein